MAQIKVYGEKTALRAKRDALSEAIHTSMVDAFRYPPEKKFHRFVPLDADDFMYPPDRSGDYTIVEVSLFEGRTDESKRRFIELLYERAEASAGLAPQDLEITLFETPRVNWGVRGQNGADLKLAYHVKV